MIDISIRIKLLWIWFYIDCWQKAICSVILRWKSREVRQTQTSKGLRVNVLRAAWEKLDQFIYVLVINVSKALNSLFCSFLTFISTFVVQRGRRLVQYICEIIINAKLIIDSFFLSVTTFSVTFVSKIAVWASSIGCWFINQPFMLMRVIRDKGRRFIYLHHNLLKKTSQSLYEYLSNMQDKRRLIAYLMSRLEKGIMMPDEILGLLNVAFEAGEREKALRCVDFLPLEIPLHIEHQRNAAVQCFLKGEYKVAEAIWTKVEEYRIVEIGKRDLDRYNIRYLAPHWFIAIGHIAHLDTFLKFQILTDKPNYTYLLNIPPNIEVPNEYFLNLWMPLLSPQGEFKEQPELSFDEVILLQEDFWSLYVSQGKALMFNKAGAFVQSAWEEQNRNPILSLPEADCSRGWGILESLGVPPGSWFACIHVREAGFHQAWHDKNPGTRNADITTYQQAIESIVVRGGFVVRLGDASMRPMSSISGLVDYALSDVKSDFMDIFLCAECRFLIGTNSGLGLIPPVFGKPCVMTNWSPIAIPQWYPNDLFIPKLVRSVDDGRLLTFKELFSTPSGWSQFEKYFTVQGLEVIDNTPDEIESVVIEMMDRLSGQAKYSLEDNNKRNALEEMKVKYIQYVGSRIGRNFLREHERLLSIN